MGNIDTYDILKNVHTYMEVKPKQIIIGDMAYLMETLQAFSRSRTNRVNKYPLVFFLENFEQEDDSAYINLTLQVAIITDSRNNISNDNRNGRIMNVLEPIYLSLLRSFNKNPAIFGQYAYFHTKVARLDIGRNGLFVDGSTSHDYIDAIELRNLQLKIHKKILTL